MARTRVIKDIENLDQAIKAEQDVESGYHSVIDENLSYWMAVEEDVIDSYTRLIAASDSPEVRKTLERIVDDSEKHRRILEQVSTLLREIVTDEEKNAKMLTNLKSNLKKSVGGKKGPPTESWTPPTMHNSQPIPASRNSLGTGWSKQRIGLALGPVLFLIVELIPTPADMATVAASQSLPPWAPQFGLGILLWIRVAGTAGSA